VDAARPPASELLAAMVAEMNELYGDIEFPGMPTATPADFAPPAGTFLVGFHEGAPVCAGGIKRIAPDAAEIKRMYVVPVAAGAAWRARCCGRWRTPPASAGTPSCASTPARCSRAP
jgi:hypothetical protein